MNIEDWKGVLDFERSAPAAPKAKARAIREAFGTSEARYYHALNRAIDQPEAMLYSPVLVARLLRLRGVRRRRWVGPPIRI